MARDSDITPNWIAFRNAMADELYRQAQSLAFLAGLDPSTLRATVYPDKDNELVLALQRGADEYIVTMPFCLSDADHVRLALGGEPPVPDLTSAVEGMIACLSHKKQFLVLGSTTPANNTWQLNWAPSK